MNLVDEVRASFESSRDEHGDNEGPVVMLSEATELATGFIEMRQHYERRMTVLVRRGYRHHAGSTLPTDGAEVLAHTSPVMLQNLIAMLMEAFCDGVLIGQQENHQVKMFTHFGWMEQLFEDVYFQNTAATMAKGFAEDQEVVQFFGEFLAGGLNYLAHMSGFAQHRVNPGKVWDMWMLVGTSVASSSYLAGYQLGEVWRDRDVLDGIVIATEEVPDGPE